jgi:hypothetical protein
MVVWKHCMDAHVHRIGLAHDSWRWVCTWPLRTTIINSNANVQFLLLRSSSKKVGLIVTMALCDGHGCGILPMVLLGLFFGFLAQGWQIHGCSRQLWSHGRPGPAICRQSLDS